MRKNQREKYDRYMDNGNYNPDRGYYDPRQNGPNPEQGYGMPRGSMNYENGYQRYPEQEYQIPRGNQRQNRGYYRNPQQGYGMPRSSMNYENGYDRYPQQGNRMPQNSNRMPQSNRMQGNANGGYSQQRYPEQNTRPVGGQKGMSARQGNGSGQPANAQHRNSTAGRTETAYRAQHKMPAGKKPVSKKMHRRKKRTALFLCVIFVILLIAGCVCGGWYLYQKGRQPKVPQVTMSLDSLDSPYAILIDKETGTVMASKNGDEIIYPASMAKVMTVLTAIEHIENLDKTITMSYDYYNMLYEQDASRAGFEPGEEAVIRDLLYGALLPSGAECCMELSIQAAGSEEAFAELMNQKAAELGLTQTHFVNSTGLHHENQYSTPHEIAKIVQAALNNKTFREVFTTHSYTVKPTSVHPDGFTFWSSMFKNMQAENVIGGEILGGKTGFTQAAGYCLVSMAQVEGREYILTTAGWAGNPRTGQYHINDAFLGYNELGRALAEAKEE